MIEALGGSFLLWGARAIGPWRLLLESLWRLVTQTLGLRFRARETLDQMYVIGFQSLPVVGFSLTFISLMLITEFSFHMKLVLRQDSLVPSFSTVLMLRELGPTVTALLLTSRIGAGIAAEIGSMKITEQLDALRLLSIDPIEYLVIPRWFGSVFATVSLSVIAIAIAILGGASIAAAGLGYPVQQYFNTMFLFTRFHDFTACVIKAAVFGTIIPMVACYHGFRCESGSEGVGNASTAAVVQGSLLIIASDFVLTYFLYAV